VCVCDAVAMPTTAASAPVFTHPDSMRSTHQVSLVYGDSARLRCEARGSPTPEIVWYKDDAILDMAVPQPITWTLELGHVTLEDRGVYTCIVYNNVGAIIFSYNVTIRSINTHSFVIFYATVGLYVLITSTRRYCDHVTLVRWLVTLENYKSDFY